VDLARFQHMIVRKDDIPMRKCWVFPLLSALGLLLTLGGSAPAASLADLFPIYSGYEHCPPNTFVSLPGAPPPQPGTPAIQPHLQGIPSFTADDVRQYLQVNGIPTADGPFTIVKTVFISNQEMCQRTRGQSTGLEPDALVCFVELQGTFSRLSHGMVPLPPSPYAYEGFDAQTGNLLLFGS
jgi:hypothetical protein